MTREEAREIVATLKRADELGRYIPVLEHMEAYADGGEVYIYASRLEGKGKGRVRVLDPDFDADPENYSSKRDIKRDAAKGATIEREAPAEWRL